MLRLDAGRTCLVVSDLVDGTTTHGLDIDGVAAVELHGATAEAVTTVRRERRAELDASRSELAVGIGLLELAGETTRVVAATVVARAGVAVEEAVLPLRIFVVAGDAGREGVFVVVPGPGALGVSVVKCATGKGCTLTTFCNCNDFLHPSGFVTINCTE